RRDLRGELLQPGPIGSLRRERSHDREEADHERLHPQALADAIDDESHLLRDAAAHVSRPRGPPRRVVTRPQGAPGGRVRAFCSRQSRSATRAGTATPNPLTQTGITAPPAVTSIPSTRRKT